MDLAALLEQRTLTAQARLVHYVTRQANPVTGAPVPQAVAAKAPPAPPVI